MIATAWLDRIGRYALLPGLGGPDRRSARPGYCSVYLTSSNVTRALGVSSCRTDLTCNRFLQLELRFLALRPSTVRLYLLPAICYLLFAQRRPATNQL